METNNFEKKLEKILKDREIMPTSNAWKRIAEQVDVDAAQKKKGYFWYGIAASFVGLVILGFFYIMAPQTSVVKVSTIVDPSKQNGVPSLKDSIQIAVKEIEKGEIKNAEFDSSIVTEEQAIVHLESHRKPVNTNDKGNGVNTAGKEGIKSEIDQDIEIKIAEVMGKVDQLESNKSLVTDAEIDSLLRAAERELLASKIFEKESNSDATALLNEVENELNQSFRSQIFESLKSGFLKARTAVAERNN